VSAGERKKKKKNMYRERWRKMEKDGERWRKMKRVMQIQSDGLVSTNTSDTGSGWLVN
jgi:hypothetical protein